MAGADENLDQQNVFPFEDHLFMLLEDLTHS